MRKYVELYGLKKSFRNLEVLKGVDFQVRKGEKVVIMGSSGSGKSTLLRCINHLEKADDGVMNYNDRIIKLSHWTKDDVKHVRSTSAMVFQGYNLFNHLNVLQNVTEGLIQVKKYSRAEAADIAENYLEKVGMKDRLKHYPSALSGGQQQRVAIARAMALNPDIILFDEPTSALDPEMVGEVLGVMEQIASEGVTMLVVTHEVGFARNIADRIVFMDNGVVCEDGKPGDILYHPRNNRTCKFLNLLENRKTS
ncbi:MAG: amino acid ABC transporter ATP-binding protein [Lachnospiraceae bacterium]|nr:amino acid ABC transporter ATP-binding protein [Lachnospiraceae bacterium]